MLLATLRHVPCMLPPRSGWILDAAIWMPLAALIPSSLVPHPDHPGLVAEADAVAAVNAAVLKQAHAGIITCLAEAAKADADDGTLTYEAFTRQPKLPCSP